MLLWAVSMAVVCVTRMVKCTLLRMMLFGSGAVGGDECGWGMVWDVLPLAVTEMYVQMQLCVGCAATGSPLLSVGCACLFPSSPLVLYYLALNSKNKCRSGHGGVSIAICGLRLPLCVSARLSALNTLLIFINQSTMFAGVGMVVCPSPHVGYACLFASQQESVLCTSI